MPLAGMQEGSMSWPRTVARDAPGRDAGRLRADAGQPPQRCCPIPLPATSIGSMYLVTRC
jgi:hypothetical protein